MACIIGSQETTIGPVFAHGFTKKKKSRSGLSSPAVIYSIGGQEDILSGQDAPRFLSGSRVRRGDGERAPRLLRGERESVTT